MLPLLLTCKYDQVNDLTAPSPSPVPSPSPSKAITAPLTIGGPDGWDFMSGGRRVRLLGSIICCSDGVDEHGWPLVDEATLQEIAAANGNYTHIRLGPYRNESDPSLEAYLPSGEWNPEFWARVDHALSAAQLLGIYVEVDLIDGWALKVGASALGGCEILSQAPDARQLAFIKRAVAVAGKYPNVLWQLSNEDGVEPCGSVLRLVWEHGVAQAIIAAEKEFGYPHHLIGTNAGPDHVAEQNSPYADYITLHDDRPWPMEGKRPIFVNEFGGSVTVEEWAGWARQACLWGTSFQMWRGDNWGVEGNKRALELLKQLRAGECRDGE